jgi:hypothetical protein
MTPAEPPPSRAQVASDIADALTRAVAERAARTPRQAAEAAWYPGHPLGDVDAIEAEIIRRRTTQAPARHSPAA